MSKAHEKVYYTQQQEHALLLEGLKSFDTRIDDVSERVRSKVELDHHFQAPNVWLTLATLADEIKMGQDNNKFKALEEKVFSSQALAEKRTSSQVLSKIEPLVLQLNHLNTFVVEAARTLNKKIEEVSFGSVPAALVKREEYDTQEKLSNARILEIENELNSLRSYHDSSTISFGQLGFRSNKECDSWMEIHHPGEDFGLLIDLHLLLEHVYVQMTGQKLISNLEKNHKMKLRSNNQALAILSFESRLPRILYLIQNLFMLKSIIFE